MRCGRAVVACAGLFAAFMGCAGANAPGPERLGKRIFQDGVNARDEPVRALVGQPPSPLSGGAASCAVCHGGDGRGTQSADGGIPDVRWSALVRADRAPRYDERLFARAMLEGIAPSGAPVGPAMPRYSLSRSELAALVAYLKSLPSR